MHLAGARVGETGVYFLLKQLLQGWREDSSAIKGVLSAALKDPSFRDRYRDAVPARRDAHMRQILLTGIEQGAIADDRHVDLVIDMIHGAIWYRMVFDKPLDDAFADALTALVARMLVTP